MSSIQDKVQQRLHEYTLVTQCLLRRCVVMDGPKEIKELLGMLL